MTLKIIGLVELKEVYNLIQNTIQNCYSKYYSPGVVYFFCTHHSSENIAEDIKAGRVYGVFIDNHLVGTGTIKENHITRVFVHPDYQGKGVGTYIFGAFEKIIFSYSDSVVLDSSLAAAKFYDKRGYVTVGHEEIDCENGSILVYEIMEKKR